MFNDYLLDSKDVTSFWICSILWVALSRWHHCSMKLFSRKQLVKLPYFSYHRYFTRSWTFSASQTALSAKWSACWPSSKQPRQIRLVKLSRHLFNYTRALYVINRAWLALKLTGHTSRGAQEQQLFSGKGCHPQIWAGSRTPLPHTHVPLRGGCALAEVPGPARGPEILYGASILIRGDISNGKKRNCQSQGISLSPGGAGFCWPELKWQLHFKLKLIIRLVRAFALVQTVSPDKWPSFLSWLWPHFSPLKQENASVFGQTRSPHGPGCGSGEGLGPGARRVLAADVRSALRGERQRGHPAAGLPCHGDRLCAGQQAKQPAHRAA